MLSRRAVLAGAGLALLPTCEGDAPGAACSIVMEVEEDRALVVVWSATATTMTVTVAGEDGFAVGRWTARFGAGGIAVVDARELVPGRAYVAAIGLDDGKVMEPHRFVTAPARDDGRAVRIAWSADIDPDPAYDSAMFETLADAQAEMFVSLGDWPYADNPPFPSDRDDYIAAHVLGRSAAKLQRWLHGTSVRGILDDHEVRNDWDAETYAENPALHDIALGVWDEWFPRRGGGPRYRRWRWGAHVECFLLDCRSHRSAQSAPDGPGKTMLGAAQRAWLVDGVTTSAATFKLVFTSVPLDYGHGFDHWTGYVDERDGILDAFADARTPGVLFLSADQHWFAAQRHRHGAREIQAGPLARAPLPLPVLRPGVLARADVYNTGVLDIDGEAVRVRVLDADGGLLWDERLTAADLTLRRGV